jgi:hypothetical protein
MNKPITYSKFKELSKLSLNDFNRWATTIYKNGYIDGLEYCYDHRIQDIRTDPEIASYTEEELFELLKSVDVPRKKIEEIVDKLVFGEGTDMDKLNFYIYIANHYDTSNPSTVYYYEKSVKNKLVFSLNLEDAKKYDSLKEAQLVAKRFGGRIAQEYKTVEDADAEN